MKLYGLIGRRLSHSFSKSYFSNKFSKHSIQAVYENFELEDIAEIQSLFDEKNLNGLNVTIPYKEAIIPFLDQLDPVAQSIGAVNTVRFHNGIKMGYNTDILGFENSLKPFLEHGMEKALVLGTGGASKAVVYALKKIGLAVLQVSRDPKEPNQISYQDCNENAVKWHRLIVNTTPVGTSPNIDQAPSIDYDGISSKHLLFDLIYNPEQTKFLELGKQRGAMTINGLSMLKIQAESSWEIWNLNS